MADETDPQTAASGDPSGDPSAEGPTLRERQLTAIIASGAQLPDGADIDAWISDNVATKANGELVVLAPPPTAPDPEPEPEPAAGAPSLPRHIHRAGQEPAPKPSLLESYADMSPSERADKFQDLMAAALEADDG